MWMRTLARESVLHLLVEFSHSSLLLQTGDGIIERKHPHKSGQRRTDKTANRQATCQQSTQTIIPNCHAYRQFECGTCSLTIDEPNLNVKPAGLEVM